MMPLNNSAAARQLGWSHPINPHDSSFTCHFMIETVWLYFTSFLSLFSLTQQYEAFQPLAPFQSLWQRKQNKAGCSRGTGESIYMAVKFQHPRCFPNLKYIKQTDRFQSNDSHAKYRYRCICWQLNFYLFFLRLAQRKHRYFCVSFQQRILW